MSSRCSDEVLHLKTCQLPELRNKFPRYAYHSDTLQLTPAHMTASLSQINDHSLKPRFSTFKHSTNVSSTRNATYVLLYGNTYTRLSLINTFLPRTASTTQRTENALPQLSLPSAAATRHPNLSPPLRLQSQTLKCAKSHSPQRPGNLAPSRRPPPTGACLPNKLPHSSPTNPPEQLKCIGGSARPYYEIDIMRCKNAGSDYSSEDIQWTCTASLPEEFKLGSTDVICEGYDSPDDPYILKGSCGVEYRLILTDKGREKYGGGGDKGGWFGGGGDDDDDNYGRGGNEQTSKVVTAIFWLIFIAVAGWIVYNAILQRVNGPGANGGAVVGNRPGWGGGGGGGGGWDDNNDDPPPPYGWNPTPGTNPNNNKQSYSGAGAGANSWRPGFWTTAAGGAAAGYAARSWANNRQQNNTNAGSGWGSGSGWGNGEGSSRSSSGSGGSPSFSSTRHESTGFGSTSRR
jgi:hypothetical protein